MADPLAELLRDAYRRQGIRINWNDFAARLRASGVRVSEGLDAALDRYALHSLDGHDECGDDCEVGAVRLALPDEAYAAAIRHGDIAGALRGVRVSEDAGPTICPWGEPHDIAIAPVSPRAAYDDGFHHGLEVGRSEDAGHEHRPDRCNDCARMWIAAKHEARASGVRVSEDAGRTVDEMEAEAGRLLVESARVRASRLEPDDAHELRHLWAAINAGNSDPCGENGATCHLDVEAIASWTEQYPKVVGLASLRSEDAAPQPEPHEAPHPDCPFCASGIYVDRTPTAHPSPADAPRPGGSHNATDGPSLADDPRQSLEHGQQSWPLREEGPSAPDGARLDEIARHRHEAWHGGYDAGIADAAATAHPSPADAPVPQSLRDAAQAVADFDPSLHDEADAAWIFPRLLATLRAALDAPALTVERLNGAILACIDAAPSRKAWEDLSIDEQSRAILRALGEGAGEGVDRG